MKMKSRDILVVFAVGLAVGLCILLPIALVNRELAELSLTPEFDDFFTFRSGLAIAAWICLFLAHAFAFFAAFEKSIPWALAVIVIPFALLVFLVLHPESAKPAVPFLILAVVMGSLRLLLV